MELKKHFSIQKLFIVLYAVVFAVYLIIGLQPAEARDYEISTELSIPSIGLISDVTKLSLNGSKLDTPDTIVGSYSEADNKTLLIGHSTTVFTNLQNIKVGDIVTYDYTEYEVRKITTLAKDDISMGVILAPSEKETIIIMTCAGELYNSGDASHRLIVTAEKI